MIDSHILTRRTACLLALTFLFIFAGACKNQTASLDTGTTNSNSSSDAPKDTGFDAQRAYAHMEKVVGFGPRPDNRHSGGFCLGAEPDHALDTPAVHDDDRAA